MRGHLAGIVVGVLTHGSVLDVPHDGAVPEVVIGRRHLPCGTGAAFGGGNAGGVCLRNLNRGGPTSRFPRRLALCAWLTQGTVLPVGTDNGVRGNGGIRVMGVRVVGVQVLGVRGCPWIDHPAGRAFIAGFPVDDPQHRFG